jgi:hypothetical protein
MPLTVDVSATRVGTKKLDAAIREIRGSLSLARFNKALVPALDDYALLDLDPRVQENLAGTILNRRTGNLAARTRVTKATVTATQARISIQTNGIPYGLIHETGGTIVPKTKQFLTIPLPGALTPSGVLRKSAGELQQNPSPFDTTFIHDGTIIGDRNGRLTPLFILRKKVEIPARRWASSAVDSTINLLLKRLQVEVDNVLRGRRR